MARTKGSVMLSPEDPFEKLLIPIVELNQRKRADYATPEDLFANFQRNALMMDLEGYDYYEDCLAMVTRKVGRIVNLRGRPATNEGVVDSIDDLIVYATLLKGILLEKQEGEVD